MEGKARTRAAGPVGAALARAWRGRRAPLEAADVAPVPPIRLVKPALAGSRFVVLLATAAMAVTLVSAGVGYHLMRQSDERIWTEQRNALRAAVTEFRALFGNSGEVDPRFVRMIEQSSGLKALKFETNPPADGREMQPVMDRDGRIAGFLTWEKTSPTAAAIGWLLPFILVSAAMLVGFAALSFWQIRRVGRALATSQARAERAADEDKLTGLPNHAKTLELLDLALAARADNEVTTFAVVELEGAEDVTANLGVLGSDELLIAAADRLKQSLPAGAMCGRIGPNDFAVILTAPSEFDAAGVIGGIVEAVGRPYWIETVLRVSAHAGYAQAPQNAATRGELTRKAELAVREAARKGPGALVAFEAAIDTVSTDQKFIHRELPLALSANELEVHYQPIVAANGGHIVGVEALLRWTHAVRGPIPPATFIPVAEQMGLMDTLGAFVLRRALLEAKRWPNLYVGVNLSPVQVRDRAIVDLVRSALNESGVEPSRLMLEITEGVLIDNPDEMVKRIGDLHALGVRIALDDFGSGYSNLGYLQRFSFDKLKIDRSFVAGLGHTGNGGVIIQAIVALGRALGLSVLVEGVETEQQRVLLRLAGCDEMQGFLFARPAPAHEVDRLLARTKRSLSK